MHSDNYATCVPLFIIASFLYIEPSVFDYCNRYRAMCDNRKTRYSKRSDAPAGVDIRTLLCPVKKVCKQPRAVHQQLSRVRGSETRENMNIVLISTEMEFTNKLCCSHFCE